MTRFLASVRSVDEAMIAAQYAAIVDFKDPERGALGALDDAEIRAAVIALRQIDQVRTSATIGDLLLDPPSIADAVFRMAATGVDYIKIGLFAGDLDGTLRALEPLGEQHRLIAVQFADRAPDLSLARSLAEASFAGMMLDTAGKSGGSLLVHQPITALSAYVTAGRSAGLLVGLAGSLTEDDIKSLIPLGADYLGFRSALTIGLRGAALDPTKLARIAGILRV